MYVIIGETNEVYQERYDEAFLDHYSEECIATFDTEKDAKAYLKKSRLKKTKRVSYGSDIVFRASSLLCNCCGARVEEYRSLVEPPHNPE